MASRTRVPVRKGFACQRHPPASSFQRALPWSHLSPSNSRRSSAVSSAPCRSRNTPARGHDGSSGRMNEAGTMHGAMPPSVEKRLPANVGDWRRRVVPAAEGHAAAAPPRPSLAPGAAGLSGSTHLGRAAAGGPGSRACAPRWHPPAAAAPAGAGQAALPGGQTARRRLPAAACRFRCPWPVAACNGVVS